MTLSPTSFESAFLKVQRANRHIEELQASIKDFTTEKFYELVVDGEPSALFARFLKPLPNDLSLIIGDAVHNLKTALDHTVTSILRGSNVRSADLLFPFGKERKGLESDRPRLDPIERALTGAKRLILEEVQPYQGGSGNLYGLHSLDRLDKHNEIITIAAIAFTDKLIVRRDGEVVFAVRRLVHDMKKPIMMISNPISVEYDSEPSLQIRFGEGLAFGSEPVIPALIQLSQRVAEIIKLFADLI